MSFNVKTIAVLVVALLAAAGGFYAIMPDQEIDPANRMSSAQTIAKSKSESLLEVLNQPNVGEVVSKDASTTVVGQTVAVEQPASQVPRKLTRAQLTPPPATEEEKLQRAAEQESNF